MNNVIYLYYVIQIMKHFNISHDKCGSPFRFLLTLQDLYKNVETVEYKDILNDIEKGYLTYYKTKPNSEMICSDSSIGYLLFDNGEYKNIVPILE